MSTETEDQPFLSGAEPVLSVTDFPATLAFYVQKLGFAVDFTYGDPPFYGVVQRDRARLCLRLVHEYLDVGDSRVRTERILRANYLATVNDLPKAVEKTADKTMKVIYTLRKGD